MDKFFRLNPEKQKRILNSALKEFAKKGYKNAMTDEIVNLAGISKGALFQYFNSKKQLFLYLYEHTLDIIMEEFLEKINFKEKDILKRLRQILQIEFILLKKWPDIFEFIEVVNREETIEIIEELNNINKGHILNTYSKLVEEVDESLFKEGIKVDKIINIIIWSMEGFGRQERSKMKNINLNALNTDEILTEIDIYLKILKESFYK